jgi:hypothetical protein
VRARAQSKTVHATKSSSFAFEVVSWVYDVKAVVQHVVFDLTCADLFGREKKNAYWLGHFFADGRLDTTERCTFSFQRRRFFLLTLTHKSCFFEPQDSHAQESLTQGIAFLPGELRIVIFRLFGADSLFIRKMSLASLLLGTWIHFQLLPRKSSHLFQPPSRQHTRLCIEKIEWRKSYGKKLLTKAHFKVNAKKKCSSQHNKNEYENFFFRSMHHQRVKMKN